MVNRQMINSWQTITIGSCVSKARKPLSSRAILIYFEFRSKPPPPRGPHSLLSFAWTITRPTNYLRQNTVFSHSEMIAVSFSYIISLFFVFFLLFYVILSLLIFTKTTSLLSFYLTNFFFFWKLLLFFYVPGCSGMFPVLSTPAWYLLCIMLYVA